MKLDKKYGHIYILYCIAQFEIGITLIVKYLQTIMYNNWLNRICEQIYLEIYIYVIIKNLVLYWLYLTDISYYLLLSH